MMTPWEDRHILQSVVPGHLDAAKTFALGVLLQLDTGYSTTNEQMRAERTGSTGSCSSILFAN